jgi:hypothetical protein
MEIGPRATFVRFTLLSAASPNCSGFDPEMTDEGCNEGRPTVTALKDRLVFSPPVWK